MSTFKTLRIENLLLNFNQLIFKAHFCVQPGERVSLSGPSGSGKTTFLKIISGLEPMKRHDQGNIFLGHEPLHSLPPQKRDIGFVFQDFLLFEYLNVFENITFGLKMRGYSTHACQLLASPWLSRMGLNHLTRSYPYQLSGGEKQRVAWIRALIWKPRLLLFDEPFCALDPFLKETLKKEFLAFHQNWPVPFLFVTHDLEEATTWATQHLTLNIQEYGIRNILKNVSCAKKQRTA